MPQRAPNVVFVICDDLAWGDIGRHGNPVVQTPRLDAMHDRATRLTRYGSGPLCTPARAAAMTGRHPYRTGAIDTYLGRSMMHTDEVTLPELLHAGGYATCLSGKWHLGDCYPMRPHDRGFNDALYHLGGGLAQPANHDWPDSHYTDPLLMRNGTPVTTRGYCTDIFTDHALAFIQQHRDQPLFCYLAFNAPHTPLEVPDEWASPYRQRGVNDTHARLYGMVSNIDHNVGRVLDELDRLGLANDTIVVFTSDHGPCGSAQHEGEMRYNANLRGIKGSFFEGGIKVPCFAYAPGRFPAGRDVDRVTNPIDWLPTFAALGGCPLPHDRRIDGKDLSPLLTGRCDARDWPDRTIPMQFHRGDVPERGRNCAVIGQRYKWIRPYGPLPTMNKEGPDQLYDLVEDPLEQRDVAAEHPDTCDRMHRAYDQWFDDVGSTRGKTLEENYAPPRIIVGSTHENPTVLTQQDWRSSCGEHFMDNHKTGHWLIDVEHPGGYRVEIVTPHHDSRLPVTFQCGSAKHRDELDPGQQTLTFEHVSLPAGQQRVDCFLGPQRSPVAVYRVSLKRIDE